METGRMQRIIDLTVEKLVRYIGETAKRTGPLGEPVPNKVQMAAYMEIRDLPFTHPDWQDLIARKGMDEVKRYVRDMEGRLKRKETM